MKKLLIVLLLSGMTSATTTVTGNVKDLSGSAVGSGNNTFVRFYIRGCGKNQPRIPGTLALIAPKAGVNGTFYFDVAANASGAVSSTIYSTRDAAGTGNGEIECGGSYTATWYGMVLYANGVAGPEIPVHANSGVALALGSVIPISIPAVSTAPTAGVGPNVDFAQNYGSAVDTRFSRTGAGQMRLQQLSGTTSSVDTAFTVSSLAGSGITFSTILPLNNHVPGISAFDSNGHVAFRLGKYVNSGSYSLELGDGGGAGDCFGHIRQTSTTLMIFAQSTCSSGILLNVNNSSTLRLNTDGSLTMNSGSQIFNGSGSPETVITAPVGSMYLRTNGGAGTSLYIKESGSGNTGWVGK